MQRSEHRRQFRLLRGVRVFAALDEDQLDHRSAVLGDGVGHAQHLGEQVEHGSQVALGGHFLQHLAAQVRRQKNGTGQFVRVGGTDLVVDRGLSHSSSWGLFVGTGHG
ncbi:TPA: hypothetical protein ACUT6C_003843 [Pseudomonas aeruginosa]